MWVCVYVYALCLELGAREVVKEGKKDAISKLQFPESIRIKETVRSATNHVRPPVTFLLLSGC